MSAPCPCGLTREEVLALDERGRVVLLGGYCQNPINKAGTPCGEPLGAHISAQVQAPPAMDMETLRALVRWEVQSATGVISPVSGLRSPSGVKWVVDGAVTPPRSTMDDYDRYKKYAESLKASLKKIDKKHYLRFDREEGMLDFKRENTADEPRYSLKILNADHLKDVYCSLTIQFSSDVDSWVNAFKTGEFECYKGILTP